MSASKTYCKHGHEWTPESTYVRPSDGARICRICRSASPSKQPAQAAVYYAANRARICARDAAYRAAHRDQLRDVRVARRAANPEVKHDSAHRLRAGIVGPADVETLGYLRLTAADPCAYCGMSSTGVDHIVPLSRGGEHHWTNITRACGACNSSKRDKSLMHWLCIRPAVAA